MALALIRFLSIILAALLAGVSFGIWIGFSPGRLSQSAYLEQQQNLVASLKTLMIALVVLGALITGVSAFLQRTNKVVFLSLLIATLSLISCMIITKFGNVPIDDMVMTWTVGTMPANWTTLRDNWVSFHIMRTWTELVALVLIVWSSIKKD